LKVKQKPADFRVEEMNRLEAGVTGDFALYRLEKSGIGTPEAVRALAHEWRLRPSDVAFAGLKDRHGITGQMVSVRRGPRRNFQARGFKLNYLGQSPRPAERGTLAGNRFRVVLRDLDPDGAARVAVRACAAATDGFQNYYDDQRFGSLRGTEGAFVARALLAGDDGEALRLAIACPARADRSRIKRRRRSLRELWGQWEELARLLDASVEQRICAALATGGSFAAAYGRLDPALRALHLSAFQAHLFNECLRDAVGGAGPRHPGVAGPYLFGEGDPGALRDVRIPLAAGDAPPHPLLEAVLARESLGRERLARLPFRGGSRAALAAPRGLSVSAAEADDLNPGRRCVALSFELGPGAYATMLVKRCTYDL
jgi:tRNA pseudouridine13 synthase